MARLALYTFGLFTRPAEDPANDGFHAVNDPIFERVRQADGFLGHATYEDMDGGWDAGTQIYPRWYEERGDGWSPATLSLWRDAEAARAFTFTGMHAAAMRRARDWFREGPWPGHVAWWVADRHFPGWAEAIARYEALADHGLDENHFTLGAAAPMPVEPGHEAPAAAAGNAISQ